MADTLIAQTAALFQAQADREWANIAFYEDAANWCNLAGYPGAADWCHKQAKAERRDWKAFNKYLRDRLGARPVIPATEAGTNTYDSLMDVLTSALEAEEENTDALEALCAAVARRHQVFVDEFLEDQDRSLREITDYVRLLQKAGDDAAAIALADKKIGR